MPQLTIGVVLYKPDHVGLGRFFKSIARAVAAADAQTTVYVKWNSRRPASEIYLASLQDSGVSFHVLGNAKNIGFGIAHNMLAKNAFEAGADWYLCINPDGTLHEQAIHTLLDFHTHDDSNSLVELRQFPREHPKPHHPLTGETPWCSGAAMSIPKKIFEATSGFDENLFMYCEDVDLSWRAQVAGFKTKVCQTALFAHDVRESKSREMTKLMLESGRYLAHKWGAGEFRVEMERQLIANQFYPETIYLPTLPTVTQLSPVPAQEWRQLLSFALPRWVL